MGRDVFTLGEDVHLTAPIAGDAVAAGASVHVDGTIRGDGLFVGGLVNVNGAIADDLYVAGEQVTLDANVAGNARLFGAQVSVKPGTVIDGAATIGGGTVDVYGTVNEYLHVFAGATRVMGTVDGELHVSGGELLIEPSAIVTGPVTFHGSKPPTIGEGAQVKGEVLFTPEPGASKWSYGAVAVLVVVGLGWWIGLALLSVGFWRLWPSTAVEVADAMKLRPFQALGVGAGTLVAGPGVVLVLALSLVGLPLSLLAACGYLLLFPLGYVTACGALAHHVCGAGRDQPWIRRLAATLGVIIGTSVVAATVPVFGPLCIWAMSTTGCGALVQVWFRSARALARTSGVPEDSGLHPHPSHT